ncbi:MAG: DUF7948 domain-containing protein, partial [Armatimonadota bacterium]
MRLSRYSIILLGIISSIIFMSLPVLSTTQKTDARMAKAYGKLPLSFVENRGQMDKRARYVISGPRASAFFRNDGVTFDLWDASKKAKRDNKPEMREHAVLKLTFKGADPKCRVRGMGALPGKVNYLTSNDRSKWHTNIPTYKGVVYKNVWRGIDVIYRGDRNQLKYDIRVNPDTDIRKIRLQYDGAEKVWLDNEGTLHIKTAVTEFIEKVPGIYQEKSGRKIERTGGYKLINKNTVGFDVKGVDPSLPLVIDPASDLIYSTFLGVNVLSDEGGITVDSSGCAYVVGTTGSPDFPTTPGAFDRSNTTGYDAFVTKLNSSGSELVYSTYIGGASWESGNGISIDSLGCAYITGYTQSYNFPTTAGAFDTIISNGEQKPGNQDAFVSKLDANGSALLYSTYMGGSEIDEAQSIVIDSSNCAYVTG